MLCKIIAQFIVNIMYGIAATLVYQFTRFMGEITVYSDIGVWHCEFVVHRSAPCILITSTLIVWFMVGV